MYRLRTLGTRNTLMPFGNWELLRNWSRITNLPTGIKNHTGIYLFVANIHTLLWHTMSTRREALKCSPNRLSIPRFGGSKVDCRILLLFFLSYSLSTHLLRLFKEATPNNHVTGRILSATRTPYFSMHMSRLAEYTNGCNERSWLASLSPSSLSGRQSSRRFCSNERRRTMSGATYLKWKVSDGSGSN